MFNGDPLSGALGGAVTDALADRVWSLVAAVWDYSLGFVVNLMLLGRHAQELEEGMRRLEEMKEDLNRQADRQVRLTLQAERTQTLSGWLGRVDALAAHASRLQTSFDDRLCCIISGFYLGHKAVELLGKVKTLADEGQVLLSGGQLVNQRGPDAVEPVHSEISSTNTLVGAGDALDLIKQYIMDDATGIIGICGMGGVGKTALLKVINNEFFMENAIARDKFEVVIWVKVSREARDISDIQETIAKRLGLPPEAKVNKDILFKELEKKRFILLLDDVWETAETERPMLAEVGVPLPVNMKYKSKILLTTRDEVVCREMGVDEIVRVVPLDTENSWRLFCSTFGPKYHRILDDPNIQPLARQVVAKCGGLPISLLTVGKAMASAKTEDDWREAITQLDHRPAELAGMQNKVLQPLKFSFDKLRNETLQNCLLYSVLFPEVSYIDTEEIVDYWICEGFLDSEYFDDVDIEATRRRGRTLITQLQNACLLEVYDDEERYVKGVWLRNRFMDLHDTIRHMALWIAGHKFVVLTGYNRVVSQIPKVGIWQKARRISLSYNWQIEEPPSSCWNLHYPNLTTLLLRSSGLGSNIPLHQDFITSASMPSLKVLDLSLNGLSELPIGITSLTSLQYLSLKDNNLTSLPVELGNLVELRQLILSRNSNLKPIPGNVLSCLSSLQVLDMQWCAPRDHEVIQRSELEDLKKLTKLGEVHLRTGAWSWKSLKMIVESPVLRRSIREVRVHSIIFDDASPSPPTTTEDTSPSPPTTTEDTISQQIGKLSQRLTRLELRGDECHPLKGELELRLTQLQHLEFLDIRYFMEARLSLISVGTVSTFRRLRNLSIIGCGCCDLTWIGWLPCLERLDVYNCEELAETLLDGIDCDNKDSVFPKLKNMTLMNLPSLKSISLPTLSLPFLTYLTVIRCPQLRRLPFGSESAPNIETINGSSKWLDGLEWDNNNHDLQERFRSKFKKF